MPRSRKFNQIKFPLVGGSYKDQSKPLSQQRTLNMYLETTKGGRSDAVLKSWPGLKLWSSGTAGEYDRGIYYKKFMGLGFKVSGSTLYSFNSSGTQTAIGTIAGGDMVTFADNGFVLVIVGGNTAYSYDGTTLSTLSYVFTPVTVDYLNNQFFFGGTDGRIYITTAGSTAYVAGNSFSPDSSSDTLIRPFVFDQFIMNFNERTVEPWQTGGGGFPNVQRADGVIQEDTGLIGRDAVAATSRAIYFLGHDSEPYQMINFQTKRIGDPAVSWALQSYSTNSSCRVFTVTFNSHVFVEFHFPSVGRSWLFSETTGIWSELDHGASGGRYIGNSVAKLFNKNLVGDISNGNIYELDSDTYQNNGTLIARERVTRPLSGEQLSAPRSRVQFSEVRFSLQTGVGNASDPNPLVQTSLSTDGVNFGNEVWHELGREGEFQQDIYHSTNVNCTDLAVKIRCTDNCAFSIYDGSALVREVGK